MAPYTESRRPAGLSGAVRATTVSVAEPSSPRAHRATSESCIAFRAGREGSYPSGTLLALGGKLFGTTLDGGDFDNCGNGCGTIFDVTTSGVERILHRFALRAHGSQPGGLIGLNGLFYGTTFNGGDVRGSCETSGCGTVFEATAAGSVHTIYSLKSISDGAGPQSLSAVNGLLYVTASYGGNVCGPSGFYGGAIFAITTSGEERTDLPVPVFRRHRSEPRAACAR